MKSTFITNQEFHLWSMEADNYVDTIAQRAAVHQNAIVEVLDALPVELNLKTLSYLSAPELLQRQTICKAWQRTSETLLNRNQCHARRGQMSHLLSAEFAFMEKTRNLFLHLGGKFPCKDGPVQGTHVSAKAICNWYKSQKDIMKRLISGLQEVECWLQVPEASLGVLSGGDVHDNTTCKLFNFAQFMQVMKTLECTVSYREAYLRKFFSLKDHCAPLRLSMKYNVELTPLGVETCKYFFDHFDNDHDGVLNFEELRGLNRAAGLDLDEKGFRWVQSSFDTNHDGNLTRAGYLSMFTDNCGRVPDLMFKDLVRLTSYIKTEYCNTSSMDHQAKRTRKDLCVESVETDLIESSESWYKLLRLKVNRQVKLNPTAPTCLLSTSQSVVKEVLKQTCELSRQLPIQQGETPLTFTA